MSARRLTRAPRRLVGRWRRERRDRRLREALPRTQIDGPTAAIAAPRTVVPVHGWALFPDGPADRVELTLDGAPAGRARLCVPRPDLPGAVGTPLGLLAGFEHTLDLSAVDPATSTVTLGGHAVGRSGEQVPLAPVRLTLAAEEQPDAGELARAALLHERSLPRSTAPSAAARNGGRAAPHVLVVTHHLGFGGGQLVLLELLERLAGAGFTGTVVAPGDGPLLERIEDAGFPVHVAGDYPVHDLELYEGRMAELVAWAAPQGFDAVLVNTLSAFHGGDVAHRLGLPAAWIVHESFGWDGFWWAAYGTHPVHPHVKARARAVFGEAEAVVFEAAATRALFERDARAGACLTLPYGIDVAALDRWAERWTRERAREQLGLDPGELVVLCVGTIEPRKGQTQLVEAFARVAPHHPRARLVLVGDRGDVHGEAPGLAAGVRGLGEQVRIERVMPDVRPWYAAADLLVCASDVESLPRTVLEAMALRLPVLATEIFGLPDVVRDGETGWLCAPRDTAALADGLARALATPPERRAALAEAARALVVAEHESGACAARYAEVLASAAAATRMASRG